MRAGETPDARGAGPRIPTLDGLRGLAILTVMLFHAQFWFPGQLSAPVDRLVEKVLGAGWSGVHLFFVLSGFLITGILLDAKGGPGYFRSFYVRRVLRIFPLYYGMIVVVILAETFVHVGQVQNWIDLRGNELWYLLYVPNMLDARSNAFGPVSLSVSWSLAIEEQFYLVWPAVVAVLARRHLLMLTAAMVPTALIWRTLVLASGAGSIPAYVLTPSHIDSLAVGAFIATMIREPDGMSRLRRWAWPSGLVASVVLGALAVWQRAFTFDTPAMQTVGYTAFALLYGALLLACLRAAPGGRIGGVFRSKVLRVLGTYSYALYLFHQPWQVAANALFARLGLGPILGSALPIELVWLVVAFTPPLLAAWLSWRFYEQPILSLKRYFPYSTARASRAAAVLSAPERAPVEAEASA